MLGENTAAGAFPENTPDQYLPELLFQLRNSFFLQKSAKTVPSYGIPAVNSQNFPDGPERMPMLFILFLRIEKRGKKYRVLHEAAVNGIVRSLFFQPPFQLPGDSQPAVAGMGIIL